MMLTKNEICRRLLDSGLDLSRCWVTAGGALVFHGLRESTADIDMGCEASVADALEAAGYVPEQSPEGNRRFHLPGNIDISENWAKGTVEWQQGIPVVSLEDVLLLKQQLNRPKDEADIAAIEEILRKKK